MTPYSADYLSLLVRKGRLEGQKENGKWLTTREAVDRYMKKVAEASYFHQESLNVKVPAAEIKKASVSLRWATIMLAVIVVEAVVFWIVAMNTKTEFVSGKYKVVEDANNNLTIYADDPASIGNVMIVPKE